MRYLRMFEFVVFCVLLFIQPGFNTIQQMRFQQEQAETLPAPVILPTKVMIPIRTIGVADPVLTAKAAVVIDRDSGAILYAKNPDAQFFPASITKMMTAVVALQSFPLDQVVVIQEESTAVGSTMKLQKDEQITIKNLIQGLLIDSGNDAAYALADAYPGGYAKFVDAMNQQAQRWHMVGTHFTNVSGVEQDEHLTTVHDIATLAKEAMKDEFFRDTVRMTALDVTDVSGHIVHNLHSTNQLLGVVPGVVGIKTGWTEVAGECLVAETVRDGHSIITVVLGSDDRFGETTQLINWTFMHHKWEEFKE